MSTRVCHMTSVHPAKDIRIFHKECASLAAHGYDVTLVVPADEDHKDKNVNIAAVPQPGTRRERFTHTLYQVYKRALATNASLYHFHDPELFVVALALKARGKRVIFDSHEDLPRQVLDKPWIPPLIRPSVSRMTEFFESKSAQRIDAVIGATPNIAQRFESIGASTAVVRNYPNLNEWSTKAPNWKSKNRQAIYVGGITQIRGAFEMIAAVKQTDAKLVFAGPLEKAIETELRNAQSNNEVELRGFLDRPSVAQCFAESMVGLCVLWPTKSYTASIPIKILEYMAAGLPVIASDFPSWRELVGNSKAVLFVDPKKPAQIAEAIQYLVDHPEEAEAMGRTGQDLVRKEYNWQAEERTLIALYERLLK